MKNFNSTAALLALIFYLLFAGFDSLIFGIALAAIVGIVWAFAFRKSTVIAFDLGGVITEGDYFTEKLKERKGMRNIVQNLRSKYSVVLLTNQNALAYKAIEKELGFGNMFDAQVVSGEIGLKKPDKGIFNYILKKFNIKPQQLVLIDDQAENVESAKKLGAAGILFSSPEKLVADLRKLNISV